MTGAQATWLQNNKSYEAIGFGRKYSKRGILHADGKFEPDERGKMRRITPDCIEVGQRTNPNG